jgi:hypothetical protein
MTAIDDLRILAGEKILIEAGLDTTEAQAAMSAI